ncbi:hypothetical protein BGZ65_001856, partial [Modicella reniformis]
ELGTDVKIDWIRAAASGDPMSPKTRQVLLAAQLTEKEVLWCKYRWYLLKYLNRLTTFAELTAAEKENRAREVAKESMLHPKFSQVNDPLDPLGVLDHDSAEQRAPPLPLLTGSYAIFKDIDLSGLARVYAEAKFIEGIKILFTRHNREAWPWRLAILGRIPETCPTELFKDLLPRIDLKSKTEKPWTLDHPWRDTDWVEVPELRTLVFGSADHEMDAYIEQQALILEERKAAHGGAEAASLDMVAINKETQEILPSPLPFPISGEILSHWYIDRALDIDRNTGQILEERRLIQCGVENHIPQLEAISEDVEILCRLIYEFKPDSRSLEARTKWADTIVDLSLEGFSVMNPMEAVQLCLGMSDEFTIVHDIRRLVLPYLTVVTPRRWQRHDPIHIPGQGLPQGQDPRNPMSYLYAYLLSQSPNHLSWVGAVVQASKPVFEVEERIISDDMELSWLTMSCMYGCRTIDDWKVMSDMIVCLPMFEQTEEVDEVVDKGRRAELRKDIFVSPSGDQITTTAMANDRPRIPQQLDPLNMYPAFVKYAPTQGLMQHALDTLEQHLTAAETLARYDLPVQLSWFLENSDSEASQLQMVTKMARLASGGPEKMGERFESEDEWMLLLDDLIRLRGGEKGGGVFGLVSEQDIYREYLAGVLSCGKFGLAKAILFPPGLLPPIRLATAEKLVIDCSNEMYNNATSGNRQQGLMKMAYDCLKVLPETTNIRREMDLIEATNFMTSTYGLTAPGTNTTILPLQIRATENRLSLVRRLIMTQESAYREHADMLELAIKVTGIGQKKSLRQQVEIQVVSMLIEASLKERNHVFALNQSERLMELLKLSGAVDLNADGSPRVRRVVKSGSFHSGGVNVQEDSGLRSPPQPVTPSQVSSQPTSRAGPAPGSSATFQPNLGDPEAKRPWEIFVRVGSESEGREYYKRMTAAGYALSCCPAEKIESVLELWRSLEMESLYAPVAPVDPHPGVVGFMSSIMDRTGSAASGLSASGLGYGSGYNPSNAVVSGSGAVSGNGRAGSSTTGDARQDPARREQSTNSPQQEGARKRDKLKSLKLITVAGEDFIPASKMQQKNPSPRLSKIRYIRCADSEGVELCEKLKVSYQQHGDSVFKVEKDLRAFYGSEDLKVSASKKDAQAAGCSRPSEQGRRLISDEPHEDDSDGDDDPDDGDDNSHEGEYNYEDEEDQGGDSDSEERVTNPADDVQDKDSEDKEHKNQKSGKRAQAVGQTKQDDSQIGEKDSDDINPEKVDNISGWLYSEKQDHKEAKEGERRRRDEKKRKKPEELIKQKQADEAIRRVRPRDYTFAEASSVEASPTEAPASDATSSPSTSKLNQLALEYPLHSRVNEQNGTKTDGEVEAEHGAKGKSGKKDDKEDEKSQTWTQAMEGMSSLAKYFGSTVSNGIKRSKCWPLETRIDSVIPAPKSYDRSTFVTYVASYLNWHFK